MDTKATDTNKKLSIIRKNTACIMCVWMLAVMLFSAFYIAAETDHDCTGEDCPICACIRQCEDTIRKLGGGTAATSASLLAAAFFLLPLPFPVTNLSRATPVTKKVRLNH